MKLLASVVLASILAASSATSDNWMTWAGKFHGDIALTEYQERQLNDTTERNAIINLNQRWTNNRVPYEFDSVFSENEKGVIRDGIADYTANTCIQFVERNGESDYIKFIKDGGCWSYVGRIGGKQEVSLANGCVYKYIVIHELMHAVGFFHEQSRYDRDSHVKINLENVCCNAGNNFNKYGPSQIQLLDEPYDLKSVMHYGEYAFSSNGQKTVEALDGTSPLGNSDGFTSIDINKVNKLYQCSTTGATTTAPTGETTAATTTTDATTTLFPETTTAGSCTDIFSNCGKLANRGLCSHRVHAAFMMDACPESCDNCDGTGSECFDKYPRCKGLARNRRDYCNDDGIIGDWMHENCAGSCQLCE